MKLRDKDSRALFIITNSATAEGWTVDTGDYLTSRQERKMASRPQMVVEFARYLKERMRKEGKGDFEVRAYINSSLNGTEAQMLIDPRVDLTQVSYPWFGHADWIFPLRNPLR